MLSVNTITAGIDQKLLIKKVACYINSYCVLNLMVVRDELT